MSYTRKQLATYYKNMSTGTVLKMYQWLEEGAKDTDFGTVLIIWEDNV